MKIILAALCLAILLVGGCQIATVKECKCPPESVYVNTEAGVLRFEAGEFDQPQTYIITQEQYDEFQRLIDEAEKQAKNKGI